MEETNSPSPVRNREEVLNVQLAACLSTRGIHADPETIIKTNQRQMPDVIFWYCGLRCVIEGKVEDLTFAHTVVENDARRRVENGVSHLAVGIIYPAKLRGVPANELVNELNTSEFEFFVHTENGQGPWRNGSIDEILSELRLAHEAVVKDDIVDRAVARLSNSIDEFSKILFLTRSVCDRLAFVLGIREESDKKSKPFVAEKKRKTAAQITALTILNAFIFQELLANVNNRVKPLNRLLDLTDFHSKTIHHWKYICEHINYVPIFNLAREGLLNIPVSSMTDFALRDLAAGALEIIAERAALRHDLMGRIFHRLLLEAKYLGTFYTSVPASLLLLKIALSPNKWEIDWSNPNEISNFKVADLACGTGTLLMAASQSITDNLIRSSIKNGCSVDTNDLSRLHQILMEKVLHGYDVLASAVHLTASTIAMLAPEVKFDKMNLFILPLGRFANNVIRLGSIEYLGLRRIETQLSLLESAPDISPEQVSESGSKTSQAPLPKINLAVMNPPFTRSVGGNLLFGSLPERHHLQRELSRRLRSTVKSENKANTPVRIQASSTAGLGSIFVAVVDSNLDNNGRLAFVLPAALLTGVSWKKTRDLIASKYILECVITSHDPDKWSFSENTKLSEVLIIALKKDRNEIDGNERTLFVNLWRNPSSGADALAVGESLTKCIPASFGVLDRPEHGIETISVGKNKYAEAISFSWVEIKDKPWIGGAFGQTDLCRAAWYLRKGRLCIPGTDDLPELPICPLSSLGELGPDRRDIYDGFKQCMTQTSYGALWGHVADQTRTLEINPNSYLEPRTSAATGRQFRRASDLWPKAGRLMLAERMRFTTQSLFCVRMPELALANVWWPFRLNDDNEKKEKALCIWFNSTLGILIAAAHRVPTEGPWVQFKKPILGEMPTLNTSKLTKKQLTLLADAYDTFRNQSIQKLPNINVDPIRNQIDDIISSTLGLPSIEVLRRLLASEPILCDKSLLAGEPDAVSDECGYYQLSFPWTES